MEEPEFQSVIGALGNMFPTLADRLTPEQVEAWRLACRNLRADRVKDALMTWYRTEEGWPVLARIVSKSRDDYGPNVSRRTRRPDMTDADRAAYKAGLAEMRARLKMPAAGSSGTQQMGQAGDFK